VDKNVNMDLSVVIVSYNTKEITLSCIKSVIKHTKGIKYEIVVVDNASSDGSVTAVQKFKVNSSKSKPKIIFIGSDKNLGFAGGNNLGIKKSKGRYVLFLNSDTIIHDNVLGDLTQWMDSHEKVGIVSCGLLNEDGSIQGTGGYFPTLVRVFSWMTIQDIPGVDSTIKPFHPMKEKSFSTGAGFYKKRKELDWVTGAFMFMRKDVIDAVGLFDERYFMYTEETDYCYRVKMKGWEVFYEPKWSITHIGGASGSNESSILKEFGGVKRFYHKHYPKWQYPILRALLKLGAFLRVIAFFVFKGKGDAGIYAKALRVA